MVDYAQPTSRGYRVSTYQNCEIFLYRNKDNNSTYFTFSIFFAKYKREEVEIRHVPSCQDKTQLPLFTSTQLVFFDKVHVKQVCRPPSTSQLNECNVLFPKNEERKVDVERGVYETNNQPNKATFKYKQEGNSVSECLRLGRR